MKEITRQALIYKKLGFSIIPLGEIYLDENNEKKIIYPISWAKCQSEQASETDILDWFETRQFPNIGIITGKISNLFVLDTDTYKPGYDTERIKSFCLPITPFQTTGRGGKQYFFRYSGNARNAVGIFSKESAIDIRANGGMVIAPPSRLKLRDGSHGDYVWDISPEDEICAPLPTSLEKLFGNTDTEYKEKKKLIELTGLIEGEGRDSAMASLVGKFARILDPSKWIEEIWPTMQAVNATYHPPLSKSDLVRIYNSITKTELGKRTSVPEDSKKSFAPSLTFSDLMAQEFPKARYAIEPFFESATVNMVSAPPNTWKSWLLFYFASCVAGGTNVLDKFATEKAKVMIVNEEDSFRSVQDRFNILNIKDRSLPIFFRIAQGHKLEKAFIENIIKEAKEKEVTVIMLDSLRAMHDAEENDSTAMQKILDMLKTISREGITVIFTHHHRKKNMFSKGDDAEASRGSSAINAAISGHISLEEEERPEGRVLIVRHLKSKAGEKLPSFEIKINKNDDETISFSHDGELKTAEKKILLAKNSIMYVFSIDKKWKTVKDFTSIAGRDTIRSALKVLEKDGVITSMTRKEAEEKKIDVGSQGKGNERLYRAVDLSSRESEEDVLSDLEEEIML